MTPFPTTKKRLVIACLSAMAMNANAADVELKIKHVDGDYGTPYSYQGYKSEIEIKPDDSRWYYNGEAREYNHDSGQQYSRFGVGIGYQFPIEGGFIKPEFKIRSERNDYGIKSDGTRGSVVEADSKILKTQYVYEIYNWFKLAGEFSFFHHIFDTKTGDGKASDYERYSIELKPALRFHPFKPFKTFKKTSLENATINFIYYSIDNQSMKGGVEAETGGTYGLDDTIKNEQLRIETSYKYQDFAIGPYARLPLTWAEAGLHYNSNNIIDGNSERYKLTRLGIKASYKVTDSLVIISDFYSEDKEYKEGYQHKPENGLTSNAKVLELGISYNF